MTHNPEPTRVTTLRFPALDGYELGGTLFEPAAGGGEPRHAVVFNCGGGVPAAVYRRFATYLASQGIPVLTYDYRGIGASRPRSLRGFVATAEDWSELDSAGAIALLCARYPSASRIGLAHSIGAMMLCGAPNVGQIAGFVFIAPHTGYFADYRKRYRVPMALLWHVVMPVLTRLNGYFPARALRIGEDIPAGVALQWAARRTPDLQPGSMTKDPGRARAMIRRYSTVSGPAICLTFADDAFATERGQKRLLALFPKLTPRCQLVDPSTLGLKQLGHFGYFRATSESGLWRSLVMQLAVLDASPSSPDTPSSPVSS
jgi:predicted alpha/beta hydrolase